MKLSKYMPAWLHALAIGAATTYHACVHIGAEHSIALADSLVVRPMPPAQGWCGMVEIDLTELFKSQAAYSSLTLFPEDAKRLGLALMRAAKEAGP